MIKIKKCSDISQFTPAENRVRDIHFLNRQIIASQQLAKSLISLSPNEWTMLVAATGAYQHNESYRILHAKLITQQLLALNLLNPAPS